MYFAPEVTRTVIARITRSLTPGGFLFLGHAETLRGISHDFHLRHTHNTFYYQEKEDAPSAPGEVRQGSNSHKDSWFTAIQQATDRVISLTHTKSEVSSHLSADFCPTPPQWDPLSTMELLQQERYAEALQAMMDLPAGVKDDPNVQLLRAVLLTNSGNLVEAEKVCHRLLELDELNAGAHYLMALCREHNGALHAAIEHNQAAVYLDPTFAMPHLHLGLMAERMGDVNGAVKEFVQARELLPAEDSNRILLFGGGFTREALMKFCHAKQQSNGDRA
jgi:chemotaxis protein methyltransferase CheR